MTWQRTTGHDPRVYEVDAPPGEAAPVESAPVKSAKVDVQPTAAKSQAKPVS